MNIAVTSSVTPFSFDTFAILARLDDDHGVAPNACMINYDHVEAGPSIDVDLDEIYGVSPF